MPAVKVTVVVEIDGVMAPNFPLVHRVTTDDLQPFVYGQAGQNDAVTFVALPTNQVATMSVLVVQPDLAMTVRLNGQTDKGIPLNAGGVLILIDAAVNAGLTTNATINSNNPVATIGTVRGLAAGTNP